MLCSSTINSKHIEYNKETLIPNLSNKFNEILTKFNSDFDYKSYLKNDHNHNIKRFFLNKDNLYKLNLSEYLLHIKNNKYSFNIEFNNKSYDNIRRISYQDNDSEYNYYTIRNKNEFILNIQNEIKYTKNKNNQIIIRLNKDLYITYSKIGKLSFSKQLVKEIYHENNPYITDLFFQIITQEFQFSEYYELVKIYNNNIKNFITNAINLYRNKISEKPLIYNVNLEAYAKHRIDFYINNKLIPHDNDKFESPFLQSFAAISHFERMKLFDINSKIYEIMIFYNDPCELMSIMMEDLSKRAILLSLNCKEIGIEYSQDKRLLCIIISYDDLKKIINDFRIYPPHESNNIRPGIMYESGNIRGYPISIHTDGYYNFSDPSLYDYNDEVMDFTGGRFYEKNAKYIIGENSYEYGKKYQVEYPFNNIKKPIKSIKTYFKIIDKDYLEKYNILK